jgi:uncharacterized membrane protein YgcG
MAACGQEPALADEQPYVAPPPAQSEQQPVRQLEQLVAPIALYPDELVAEILTAATYPTEVVEAWRWMQQQPDLKGKPLADAVDTQPWDPSVKALTQFPSVLDNMNQNLSWTSALGDAYVNQRDDVMSAVQALRKRAQASGALKNTGPQTVATQDGSIVIEPANPDFVYVPAYDPWLVYGVPLVAYPDWVAVPGVFYAGPDLYFGLGFDIGLFAGFGWGWHNWGFDWHDHHIVYHHEPYFTHSRTFADRHAFNAGRAHFDRPGMSLSRPTEHFDHPGAPVARPTDHLDAGPTEHFDHAGEFHAVAPVSAPRFEPRAGGGFRPGAFSGFDHGGVVRSYASRGLSSFGGRSGGGFARGGFAGGSHVGGGFHGGGGGHR